MPNYSRVWDLRRYLGGLITTDETQVTPANNFENTAGNAVFTSDEQLMLNKQSLWPTAGNISYANIFSANTYSGSGSQQQITNSVNLSAAIAGGIDFATADTTTLASHSGFDFGTNNFTIEFWYKWSTNSGYQTLLNHQYNLADGVAIQSNTGTYKWAIFGSGLSLSYEASNATLGVWHHYAFVRNSNTVKIYRDGVETLSQSHTSTVGGTDTTIFGDATGGSYPDKGKLSNFRVIKGTALYTSAFSRPTAPLTAISGTSLLLFQENSGSTLTDGSSNNVTVTKGSNHSILTSDGPPLYPTGEGGLVILRARTSGASLVFDTVRDIKQKLEINTGTEVTRGSGEAFNSFNSDGFTISGDSAGDNLNTNGTAYISWTFRKASKLFDIVTYTGDDVNGRTVSHNLGVAPEMMIIKGRTVATAYRVYHSALGQGKSLNLSDNSAESGNVYYLNNTAPTSTLITLGQDDSTNGGSSTAYKYVAYLFATVAGVSKVGSFSHTNGSSTDVDCGFSSGSAFILVKRTDSTSDWYVWDNARGIVSGNDGYVILNSSTAENTSNDYVDPLDSGFQITSSFTTGSYIFYAIAA